MSDYFSDTGLADKQVLGCALNEFMTNDFLRLAHRLSPEHFLPGPLRNLAIVVWSMLSAGDELGLVPVATEANSLGVMQKLGGGAALAELGFMAPTTPEMLERNVAAVEERFRARRFGEICTDYGRKINEPVDHLISGLTAETAELVLNRSGELTTPAQRLPTTINEMFSQTVSSVRTGYASLDSLVGGLYPGRFYILGGRPSHGKTALAMGIADHACRAGKTVAVFSLEMTQDELLRRLLALQSGVDLHLIETQKIPSQLAGPITSAANFIHNYDLHIFAGLAGRLATVLGTARQIKRLHGLDLIIIDYLQLMTPGRAQNREQEVAAISRGLKTTAMELGAPVLALSQLRRPGDQRANAPPTMSDLRESGAQEADADVVLLVWRPNKDAEEPDNIAELIVDKNRHGPTGRVRLPWTPSCARFG